MNQRRRAAIRWLRNAYHLAQRSFPSGFRACYGREMYEAFTDSLRQRGPCLIELAFDTHDFRFEITRVELSDYITFAD